MTSSSTGGFIRANGIDVHYVEQGNGPSLVLLHGGMVSTNPIWAPTPISYANHMQAIGRRYRVIAPDTRGAGKTVHDGGVVTFDVLADDVLAFVDALALDRPILAGFSEGGVTATIAAIRDPDRFSAVVNDAGYDPFNPGAASFVMMRQMLGGSPTASAADPDAVARMFAQDPQMSAMFELLKADEDGGQGDGHWAEYLSLAFHRTTQAPGYLFADWAKITAPTLILVGDRDDYCTLDDGLAAYRQLSDGELAVLPGTGHVLTPAKVAVMLDFIDRHRQAS